MLKGRLLFFAVAVLAVGLVLHENQITAQAASLKVVPIADAYVTEKSPNLNKGRTQSLRTDGEPLEIAYLRLDVAGVSFPVRSASLRLYNKSSSGAGYLLIGVADNSWTEDGLTYLNSPAISPVAIGASGPVSSSSWTSFDLGSVITANGQYSFAIKTTSNAALAFASRESGAKSPYLVIESEQAVQPTNTPSFTSTPTVAGTGTSTSQPTFTPTPTRTPTPVPASSMVTQEPHFQFVSWPAWGYLIEEQSPVEARQCVVRWDPSTCSGYWVINPQPGAVLWNIDDLENWQAYGSLDPGASHSIIERTIVDNRFHMMYIAASVGQNRSYRLTVSVPEWGASYSRNLIGIGSFCVFTPWSSLEDPRFQDIPNSRGGNGLGLSGRGLPANFVWTITNTDGFKASSASLTAEIVYPTPENQQAFCGGTTQTSLGNGLVLVGP